MGHGLRIPWTLTGVKSAGGYHSAGCQRAACATQAPTCVTFVLPAKRLARLGYAETWAASEAHRGTSLISWLMVGHGSAGDGPLHIFDVVLLLVIGQLLIFIPRVSDLCLHGASVWPVHLVSGGLRNAVSGFGSCLLPLFSHPRPPRYGRAPNVVDGGTACNATLREHSCGSRVSAVSARSAGHPKSRSQEG